MMTEFKQEPNEREFTLALDFITFLFKKYGDFLICVTGPEMGKVKKSPEKLMDWLQQEYLKGNYNQIDYGVWFALDESLIPKAYIPEAYH